MIIHQHEEASETTTLAVSAKPKRKLLPGYMEEIKLSTLELPRLVRLEQLRYTHMKIRRLEQSE